MKTVKPREWTIRNSWWDVTSHFGRMLTFNFHIYLRIVLILIISIMCKMNFYFRYQSVLNSSKLRKIVRMNRTHCRLVLCVPGFLTTFGFVNHSNKHFYFLYFIALALSISLTNSIFSIGWNSHSRHEHQSGKSSSNNHSARHSQPYPDEPPRLFHGKKYFFFSFNWRLPWRPS